MSTLYDCFRPQRASKSPLSIGLAMVSLLICLALTPDLYGHVAVPTAPGSLTATAMSNARIDLAWTDNSNNEDGFSIEIKVGAAGVYSELDVVGANVKSYSSTGLDAGTQYFYRVRAFNAEGNSAFSNQANATTLPDLPAAPSSLSAMTQSNTQINLTWTDNSNNEDGFKIEHKLNSAVTYTQIATVNANVTTYQNTGLTTNTGYSYRVRAYNTGGNSGYSNAATATTLPNPPNAPANLTATTVSNKRIDIAWTDNAGDELGFIIERKTGSGGVYGVIDTINANATAFSNANLAGGKQYFFRVRAYNAGGNSDYTNEANATTLPDVPTAPTSLTATATSNGQVDLAWADNSSNEDGFRIEIKIGTFGTYSEIDVVNANVTSYASTGLEAGIPYFYRVRAFNVTGNSNYSNEVNAFTLPDPPVAPGNLQATTTSNTAISLAWTDNSNNEDALKIERRLNTAVTYTEIATVGANTTSFNNTGLAPNTAYSYRVRAINGGGTSAYSNVSSATTFPNPPGAPSNLSATTISNSQIDLGWQDNATNELGFIIERKAGSSGVYAPVDTVDANVTNFVSLGLTGSIQYFYRVRAYNNGGFSGYSNEANATTLVDPPGTPTNLTATTLGSSRIGLIWTDNASNELGYKIELKIGATGTFAEIDEVGANVTTYESGGLDADTQYFYRVRAFRADGFSGYSNEANATTMPDPPLAPSGLTAKATSNTQIDLAWKDNSSNETGFKIERKLNSALTFTQIATVGPNVTSYSSMSLTANTPYTYRVRAYNATGNSSYSNLANAVTLPNSPAAPTNLIATAENNRQINLKWTDNAANEAGFIVERKTGASGVYAKIDTVNANVATFANIDLAGGTQYFYKVTAYNAGGNSAASNEASATTLLDPPDTPSNLVAAAASHKRINLAWQDNADNEDGYKIERKTDAVGSTFAQYATVGPNVSSFADTGLTALSTYFYRVVGFNADGQSGYSNEASAKTFPNPPGAPSNLTATPLSNKQIKLAWTDNASNEAGFKIERKTGATGLFAEVGTVAANVKTFTDTSLSASTEFFYRLRAFNLGNNSAYTNEANATTLPNAPEAPSNLAVKPGKKRMTLEWSDNADNEAGVKIERKQGTAVNFTQIAVLAANAVTYADTGLGVNTKYTYRIRAHNTGGHSAYSPAVTGTTFPNPPAAPTTLAAKAMSSKQIDLSWQDKSGNEAGFKIERKAGNAGKFTQIATVGANVTSFSSLNLNPNTKYFYRVRAYNAGGNSPYSNTTSAITLRNAPVAPANLATTTMSSSRINLVWQDKSANEDSFMVERASASSAQASASSAQAATAGAFAEIAKLPANAKAFADTGLSASTQYFYRVRASNNGGPSPYSNEANATTNPGPPEAPAGLTATPVNQTRIALVWTDNANNEAGFKIERKTGAGAFAQVGTANANATSFADTGLVANTEYIYRVRSSNVTANSAYTNEAAAKTFPVPPAAPAGLTASPLVNLQISLAWQDKSANEDSFRIERKQGAAGTFALIATLPKNATSFADGNLNPVTPYVYRVRAMNLGGNSGYTNEAAATTLVSPPLAPGNLTGTTAGQTQINLAWADNSNNEDGFKIERKITGGEFAEIASMAANVKNYQDNGLSQDIEYVYRVRAFNAGGNSDYSGEITAITLPNPPKSPVNLKATPATNKRINLAWVDSSKNEAGFKVERKKGAAGTYAQIASIGPNASSYADTTLLAATQYFYRVRAFNIGGNSGYSLEANATTLPNPPKKPANLTATAASNKRINLAWNDSSTNENGFRIERKKGPTGTYAQIAQVNANVKSYADTTLTAKTAYSYRVRAFNAGGNSLYSNEVTATTLPNPPKAPAKLTATAVSKTRINLAWADSSNDETGFRIERKTGAAGTYAQVGSVNANVKTFADTSLIGGTQYFYRVRAFNTGGNSGYSNEANAKTFPNAPAAPNALAATVAGGDKVTIAWQDNSNDEDGFKVESKLGADGTYAQIATVGPNVTNYESEGLTEGVTYFYRVRAFNIGGNSAYSNEASAIPSSGTNFALNKPAEASSTDSSSAVSLGNDGDAVTFWRSGFVNSANAQQTYQVQLHSSLAITIGRVVVKWYQTYYANEYDIQVSNDASNWTTMQTNTAVTTGTQEMIFAATPAKYVRLLTKKNNKSNYRIAEFEVYGATIAKSAGEIPQSGTSEAIIPETLVLEQNYPNPFNPSTTISYALPEGMHVTLKVINVAGQEVASLVDGHQERGIHRVTFNGRKLPSGVYYAVMKAGETTQTKRMVLAK
jgi:titin